MTKAEFIQRASIAFRTNGAGAKEAWQEATALADAAPAGTFDAVQATRSAPASSGASSGAVFPNFGYGKGTPIAGASEKSLRFYAGAAMRTLADGSKERWHDKERENLAVYVAELERQGKDASEFKQSQDSGRRAPPVQQTAPVSDDDLPPF